MMGLYFEELEVGRVFALGSYSFTAENIQSYTEQFAPVPFHMNDEDAASGLFGRKAAVGFHICSAWMPCFVDTNVKARDALSAAGKDLPEIGAGFGLHDINWLAPVHAGDEIVYRSTLTFKRELQSRPQWGLIETLNEGLRDGFVVVRFSGKMLAKKRTS
jgi:acyl dehydratase